MLLDCSSAISGVRVSVPCLHISRGPEESCSLSTRNCTRRGRPSPHRSTSVRPQATPGPCTLSKQCGHLAWQCPSAGPAPRCPPPRSPPASAGTRALRLCHWSYSGDAVSAGCTLFGACVSQAGHLKRIAHFSFYWSGSSGCCKRPGPQVVVSLTGDLPV